METWQICHIQRQISLSCWWRESKWDIWQSIRHRVLLSNINFIQFFPRNGFRWKDTSSWTFQLQQAQGVGGGRGFAVPLHGKGTAGAGSRELLLVYLQDLWRSLRPSCRALFYFIFTPRTTGRSWFERRVASRMLNPHFLLFKISVEEAACHWIIWFGEIQSFQPIPNRHCGQHHRYGGACSAIHQARGQNRTRVYGF